jgi:hypothetical protein
MTAEKKHQNMQMLIIALLVLNILFGAYLSFFKRDAFWLETLKAWGSENMQMAQQLYTSPVYIQQQKSTLDQILGSMNQATIQDDVQQAPAVGTVPEGTPTPNDPAAE